jgi:subtilase family serine protease
MRQLRLATIGICVLAACVCAALLGSATTAARAHKFHAAGTIFVPSGPPQPPTPLPSPVCSFLCYSPQQLQVAYDFPTGKHAPTGEGQTILIVVAFGSATIESDLAAFNTAFNLPPTTLSYCGAPNDGASDPGLARQWGPETSSDVEYAHAMAPDANIVLAISPSDDFADIAATEAECFPQYPGAIVIQAFGEDETDATVDPAVGAAFDSMHQSFVAATEAGGTILAASGDFGATGINGDGVVAEFPASDPLVTAVGGTQGSPYPDGLLKTVPARSFGFFGNKKAQDTLVYGGEDTWNEGDTFGLVTGGAPSILFPTPKYQRGFNDSPWRTTSDVAYDAAVQGGEAVIWNERQGVFAGTSIGPVHWAAIVALANELRSNRHQDSIGQLNPALYDLASDRGSYRQDFHDITNGNNADGGPGFDAGRGYDIPTGLGTPDVSNLIGDLARLHSRHDDDGDDVRHGGFPSFDFGVGRGDLDGFGHRRMHVG